MPNAKETEEDVRLDKKVIVKSIAPWDTGAKRVTTNGDILIPQKGSILLSREEIIAQAQNGNKLLCGEDGLGSHATWYIEDEFTRRELSFDMDGKSQLFLTKGEVARVFELKTDKSFEENIQKLVTTRAEGVYLFDCINTLGINNHKRIAFCQAHTGIYK